MKSGPIRQCGPEVITAPSDYVASQFIFTPKAEHGSLSFSVYFLNTLARSWKGKKNTFVGLKEGET